MRNAGLDEVQAGIKIARRNINNLRYADDTTLMAESKEELKRLLMKVKEGVKKLVMHFLSLSTQSHAYCISKHFINSNYTANTPKINLDCIAVSLNSI